MKSSEFNLFSNSETSETIMQKTLAWRVVDEVGNQ